MFVKDITRSQYTNVSAIYKLYFNNDDRFYIGSTNNLQERLQAHVRAIDKRKHFNRYLQRLCLKLGVENLKYEIITKCTEDKLLELEQYYIDNLKPELNLCDIAGRPPKNRRKGYKMSEEVKRNISNSKKGKKSNRNGYKHSKETLQKISNKLKGRIVSEETKQKIQLTRDSGRKYSKLTKEQVIEIRKIVFTMFDKDIAVLYNVSRATINQIKNNKIWKNI